MARSLLIIIAALCGAVSISAESPLLFVGNSYTYYNDLPSLVWNLVADGSPEPKTYAIGGHFWWQDAIEVRDDLTNLYEYLHPPSMWRNVILQEQSIAPSTWICENSVQEQVWANSTASLLSLNALTKALLASPSIILYEYNLSSESTGGAISWPDYSSMQSALIEGYSKYYASLIAEGYSVAVAPVGHAFRIVKLDPTAVVSFDALYYMDGSHPSLYGTYLAGIIIASRVTGGSPSSFTFTPTDVSDEQADYLKGTHLTLTSANHKSRFLDVAAQAYAEIGVTFSLPSVTSFTTVTLTSSVSSSATAAESSTEAASTSAGSSRGSISILAGSSTTESRDLTMSSTSTPSPTQSETHRPPVDLLFPLWVWLAVIIVVVLVAVGAFGFWRPRSQRGPDGHEQLELEEEHLEPLAEDI